MICWSHRRNNGKKLYEWELGSENPKKMEHMPEKIRAIRETYPKVGRDGVRGIKNYCSHSRIRNNGSFKLPAHSSSKINHREVQKPLREIKTAEVISKSSFSGLRNPIRDSQEQGREIRRCADAKRNHGRRWNTLRLWKKSWVKDTFQMCCQVYP